MIGLKFSLLRLGGGRVWECSCRGTLQELYEQEWQKFDFKSEITYLTVVILSWSVIKFFEMSSNALENKRGFQNSSKQHYNRVTLLKLSQQPTDGK